MDLLPLRLTVASMLGAIPFLGLALSFVVSSPEPIGPEPEPGLPWAALAGLVAWGAVVHLLNLMIGRRVSPRRATTVDPRGFVRSSTLARATLSESVLFVAVALVFLVDAGQLVVFGVGAAVTVVLFVVDVWPGERRLRRYDETLWAAGAMPLRQGAQPH